MNRSILSWMCSASSLCCLLILSIVGCSIPEGGSPLKFTDPAQRAQLVRKYMLEGAKKWADQQPSDSLLGDVRCRYVNKAGEWTNWLRFDGAPWIMMPDVLKWLAEGKTLGEIFYGTMQNQADLFAAEESARRGVSVECKPRFVPGFRKPNEKLLDPDEVTDDDLLEFVLDQPPSSIGVIVPVGVPLPWGAPIPVLCPLNTGATCPTDPRYPPGDTPQPQRSNGGAP